MTFRIHPKKIAAGFVVAAASLSAAVSFASAQSLDFQFFRTRVEPILLKQRADHVRCYSCHQGANNGLKLESLSPGSTSWTEEQSRRNFETVSKIVVPGNPTASRFLMHPLAPEEGGDPRPTGMHQGGRQFASQDDPDWKTLAEWVRGQKAGGSSAP
jgi:hypothetical protein